MNLLYESYANLGLPVLTAKPSTATSLSPSLSIVSIIPGIDALAPGSGAYEEHGPYGMAGGEGHGNRFRRADVSELPFLGTEGHQD